MCVWEGELGFVSLAAGLKLQRYNLYCYEGNFLISRRLPRLAYHDGSLQRLKKQYNAFINESVVKVLAVSRCMERNDWQLK